MRHSQIRVLLRRSRLRASPHAGNQPHHRVCVLGANPAPSHTAAGAQYIRVSDCPKDRKEVLQDVPYCLRLLGMPRAADQVTFDLL
jgi:hypothetical protein